MADLKAPAAPQAFTFGTQQLSGVLLSFNGQSRRRGVVHQFLKRRGAKVEDMNGEPRRLEVTLVFTGKNPAKDFNDFETAIDKDPTALLVHPVAGRYTAFCEGPQSSVNLEHELDAIHVRVTFIESELDANIQADVPDVATASQSVSAEQTNYQKVLASYTAALASANTAIARSKAAITNLNDQIDAFTDPVTTLVQGIITLPGVASSLIGSLESIQTLNTILDQQMTDYVNASSDLFTGAQISPGSADSTANLMGVVQNTAAALENLLMLSGTPGGPADVVGAIEEAVSACYVLAEAVLAARPVTVVVTVTELTDLTSFCQRRYPTNALARVSDVMGLNQILNPAAIPAGTRLVVPAT